MKTYIGIDTGAKGAIAVRHADGTKTCFDMPPDSGSLYNLLNKVAIQSHPSSITVAVEALTGGHGMGSKGTFFKQGVNYGRTMAACDIFAVMSPVSIHIEIVKPETWQKCVTTHKKAEFGNSYTKWKSYLTKLAQDRHKNIVCFDSVGKLKKGLTKDAADAVLILDYAIAKL